MAVSIVVEFDLIESSFSLSFGIKHVFTVFGEVLEKWGGNDTISSLVHKCGDINPSSIYWSPRSEHAKDVTSQGNLEHGVIEEFQNKNIKSFPSAGFNAPEWQTEAHRTPTV